MNYVFSKDLLGYSILSVILTIFASTVFIVSKLSILIPIIIVGLITSISCIVAFKSLRDEEQSSYDTLYGKVKVCSKCDNLITFKDNTQLGHSERCEMIT